MNSLARINKGGRHRTCLNTSDLVYLVPYIWEEDDISLAQLILVTVAISSSIVTKLQSYQVWTHVLTYQVTQLGNLGLVTKCCYQNTSYNCIS